jgi:site-specific DNA-methyltransferase (adenine-specific)/modification methylase
MAEKVVIGNAELWHGDCREVLPLLAGIGAIVTDPPYGVSYSAGGSRHQKVQGGIVGDEQPPDLRWMAGHKAIIWGGNNFCDQLPRSTGWLVWDKTHADTCHHSQAELAWTNVTSTIRHYREAYHGFMRQRDGWFHPTQKAPGLMRWCLGFMPPDDVVFDPYMGSGTTGVAAMQLGRRFVGCEIDRRFFDIACERIEKEQGQANLFHADVVSTRVQQPELLPESA